MWQTSNKVLVTDGFCVCDTAQSFHGLGKGTQVLCSTSNKRRTLRQHLSYERLQRSFLVLEATHVPSQRTHHPSFSNTCVCQISNASTIHLLPSAPQVGLGEFPCDVFEVTAPLRCTLCTTLPSHGEAVLQLRPQLRHCTGLDQHFRKLPCLSVSCPAATATETSISMYVILSRSAVMKGFLICDTVRTSSSHTYC